MFFKHGIGDLLSRRNLEDFPLAAPDSTLRILSHQNGVLKCQVCRRVYDVGRFCIMLQDSRYRYCQMCYPGKM